MSSKETRQSKLFSALFAAILVFAMISLIPSAAFAASAFDQSSAGDSYSYSDSYTGNTFLIEHPLNNASVENDLYWAGSDFKGDKLVIGSSGNGSALVAGNTIEISNSKIADSLRIAGNTISVSNTEIKGNITIAGSSLSFDQGTKANGLYAAGASVSVAGSYNGGMVAGATVSFDGIVEGDLTLDAGTVIIGPNAQIKGTLTVPANADLSIDDSAQIANTKTDSVSVQEESSSITSVIAQTGIQLLVSCMAHVLLVLLFYLLLRGSLFEAARMSDKNFGKIMLTGLVIFFALPIVAFLLVLPVITIPVVVLIAIVMVTVWFFSIPFAGSALGMTIFKKMNPLGAAVVGTIILTVICYLLPFMLFIVPLFTTIYTAGYFGQKFLTNRREQKQSGMARPFEQQ